MIDTWSVVHILLVMATCFGQVFFLKGLFAPTTGPHKMGVRA